jgi:hypothetical protein
MAFQAQDVGMLRVTNVTDINSFQTSMRGFMGHHYVVLKIRERRDNFGADCADMPLVVLVLFTNVFTEFLL